MCEFDPNIAKNWVDGSFGSHPSVPLAPQGVTDQEETTWPGGTPVHPAPCPGLQPTHPVSP